MSYILCFLIAIFLLARTISTEPGSIGLAKQLHSILTQPGLSESPDVTTILQNLNKLTSNTNDTFSASQKSHQTFTGLEEACEVGQLLLGPTGYLDALSVGYVNATKENWYLPPYCRLNSLTDLASRSETSWLPARCIFQPASNAGVAISMKIAVYFAANFAVRSGGHNANSGYGSIDGSGLLIDLTRMTELSISSDHTTVSVGPGNRWIDVYTYLDEYGLSAIGTKEPGPGVGGSILGGIVQTIKSHIYN